MSAPAKPTRYVARLVLAVALLGESAVIGIGLNTGWHAHILRIEAWSVLLFAVALLSLKCAGLSMRTALLLVVGTGILFQIAAVSAPPTSSDDVYRYVWDGKVQLAGIDPYRYAPSAPELNPLHGTELFGDRPRCAWFLPDGTCTRINRPTVRTVYPPVAEGSFTLGRLISFGQSDGPFPQQVLAGLVGVGLSLLLAWRALKGGLPAWPVALWAWCPVTVVELGNNGHVDGLAALLSVAALIYGARGAAGRAGVLFGAAVVTKLYPGLLLPVLLRRSDRGQVARFVLAAVATGILVYVPHIIAVGFRVIGFLPGYLHEEGYGTGSRFLLLSSAFSHHFVGQHSHLFGFVASGLLLVAALVAFVRTDPDHPELAAVWLTAVVLLVTAPSYSWYALLLLALVAMTGRLEWLPLAVLPTFGMLLADRWASVGAPYFDPGVAVRSGCYALGLVAGVVGSVLRRHYSYSNHDRIGRQAVH